MNFFTSAQDFLVQSNLKTAKYLGQWGLIVARNPWICIFASTVISLICGLGFLNVQTESDQTKLWIPEDTEVMQTKQWLKDTWETDYKVAKLLLESRTEDQNVLRVDLIDELYRLDVVLKAINNSDGCNFHTCLCGTDGCYTRPSIFSYFCGYPDFFARVVNTTDPQAELLAIINRGMTCQGRIKSELELLGLPQYDDQGMVVGAKALKVIYFTKGDTDWHKDWRDEVLDWQGPEIRTHASYFGDLKEEVVSVIVNDLWLIGVSFLLMFCVLCLLFFRRDLHGSRVVLALCGELSIILAIVMGYGLSMGMGVPVSTIIQILPFVIIAIGVDDMLIIFSALKQVKQDIPNLSVEDRFRVVLEEAGLTVTITSFTNMLAFILGTFTSINAIQYFSVYAMLTIFTDYLLQLSFFLGCMVLVERHADRFDAVHCCACFCPMNYKLPERSFDDLSKPATGDEENNKVQEVGVSENSSGGDWRYWLTKPWWVMMPVPLRLAVLVCTVLLAALALIYVPDIKEGIRFKEMVADDSFLKDFYELNERTYETHIGDQKMTIYFRNVDQSDPLVQLNMLEANAYTFNNSVYASPKTRDGGMSPDNTWLEEMIFFARGMQMQGVPGFNNSLVPCAMVASAERCAQPWAPPVMIRQQAFYPILDRFITLTPMLLNRIIRANVTDENGVETMSGEIIFSSFAISTVAIPDDELRDYHEDLLENIQRPINDEIFQSEGEDDVLVFNGLLVLAQQEIVLWPEAINNLIFAGLGVMIVSSLTLIHPVMIFAMAMNIFLIDSFLFGLMYCADIRFNSFSLIILVMAIGLSVDYSMHVMHCFLSVEGESRSERIFLSLQKIGSPVMMGVATTIVGMFPLAFGSSTIVRVFFTLLLGVACFSAYTGLVFVPIVLSLVGPPPFLAESTVTSKLNFRMSRQQLKLDSESKATGLDSEKMDEVPY